MRPIEGDKRRELERISRERMKILAERGRRRLERRKIDEVRAVKKGQAGGRER